MALSNHPLFPTKLFTIVSLLAVGLVAGLYVMSQNTDYRQQASEAEDLNSSNPTMQTINSDGTMGPAKALANFSNTLPDSSKGSIAIKIAATKFPITPAPTYNNKGIGNKGKSEEKKGNSGGHESFTSLKITITKVEVHLAQLCDQPTVKGKDTDKWETIEIDGTSTAIDLGTLANENLVERLAIGTLACGKYTELRMYVSKAVAKLSDGKEVPITIPGKAGIVRINRPFTVDANGTTDVTITINADKSVVKAGNFYILKPVVGKFTSN